MRALIEDTTLTYGEIAGRTGVGRASICRWTRDQNWQRPLFAPRATDTVPTARAGARLKARTLSLRLAALAERYVRELEDSAGVDLDKLSDALELLKMAKLAARPRRRRGRGETAAEAETWAQTFAAPARKVLKGLRAAGVDTDRAPEEALEDFIASRAPPPARTGSRRGRRFTRRDYHEWMLRRDGE